MSSNIPDDISLDWERLTDGAPQQREVYLFMVRHGDWLTPTQISERLEGVSYEYIKAAVITLKNKGLMVSKDRGLYKALKHSPITPQDIPPETIGKLPYSVIVQKGEPVNSPFTSLDDDTNLYEAGLRLLSILIPEEDLSMMIQESGGVLDLPLSPMFRNLDGSRKKITLIIRVEEATPERPAQKEAPPGNKTE